MNKSEIEVGGIYIGKTGRKRRVVGTGGLAYFYQIDQDTVSYVDANAGVTAREKSMTRASFAAWAVRKDQ